MSDETVEISEGRHDRICSEGEEPPRSRASVPADPGDDGPIETIEIDDDPRNTLEKGEPEPAREA